MVSQKKDWLSLSFVLFGVSAAVPAFELGAGLSQLAGFFEIFMGLVLSGIVWAGVSLFFGHYAVQRESSTYELMKSTLPAPIYLVPILLVLVSLIFWFGLSLEVFVNSMSGLVGQRWRFAMILLGGLSMTSTAMVGFRGLQWLSKVATPIFFLFFLIIFGEYFGSSWPSKEFHFANVVRVFSIACPALILGATLYPDLARLSRTMKDMKKAALLSFGIIAPGILLLTSLFASVQDKDSWLQGLMAVGGQELTVLVLLLAVWTTNDNNLYSASLAMESLLNKSRKTLAATAGFMGTVLALVGVSQSLMVFLEVLGLVVFPITGSLTVSLYLKVKLKRTVAVVSLGLPFVFGLFILYSKWPSEEWAGALAYISSFLLSMVFCSIFQQRNHQPY